MESLQGQDLMSRNCGKDARPAPPRPCPPRWLPNGALLLNLLLLSSVCVCFWQLYALQTRVQGLQDQLARCPCGGDDPGRAVKPDGEALTAAAVSAETRKLSSTQRKKQTEVDKEDNMYNVTGGSDIGRKMQRGRRAINPIAPAMRRFVRNKLKKLREKFETTQRELNTSWHHELRRHQENLTLHPRKVRLQDIHLYAYVNTSDQDRRKMKGTNPPIIDVKTGNLTQYGLEPQQNSTAYTIWKIASWFKHCILRPESAFHFPCDSPGSKVTILTTGVYYIYANITYQDDSVTAGFNLVVSRAEEGRRTERRLVKCINRIRPQSVRDRMFRTCHVSTLQRLNAGDDIRIDKAFLHGTRVYIAGLGNNHPKPAETSFWGMIQISGDDDE